MRFEILDSQGQPTGTVLVASTEFMFNNYPEGRYRVLEEANSIDSTPIWSTFIDIGSFYDRFGEVKLAILMSTDPVVKAILADLSIRKWLDLSRPDVLASLEYIGSKVPELTNELILSVINTPVSEQENLALRKTYFSP